MPITKNADLLKHGMTKDLLKHRIYAYQEKFRFTKASHEYQEKCRFTKASHDCGEALPINKNADLLKASHEYQQECRFAKHRMLINKNAFSRKLMMNPLHT